MDEKVRDALITLGFQNDLNKPPKLKVVTKRYYELALKLHPDKTGGDGEKFKNITLAFRIVGEYIEENEANCDDDDIEEMVARKVFKQFEFAKIKENLKSFTIHIENELSLIWDKILSKHFGSPLDKAENGKHWKCKGYKDDKENVADVTFGKWHIPKKDKQSKIHIQTNTVNGKYLSAHLLRTIFQSFLMKCIRMKKIKIY